MEQRLFGPPIPGCSPGRLYIDKVFAFHKASFLYKKRILSGFRHIKSTLLFLSSLFSGFLRLNIFNIIVKSNRNRLLLITFYTVAHSKWIVIVINYRISDLRLLLHGLQQTDYGHFIHDECRYNSIWSSSIGLNNNY